MKGIKTAGIRRYQQLLQTIIRFIDFGELETLVDTGMDVASGDAIIPK